MRIKAESFKVNDPDKAMQEFTSLLGKIVKVPKSDVRRKQKKTRLKKRKKV